MQLSTPLQQKTQRGACKMKESYIEEKFPAYFIFGRSRGDGKVDVCTVNGTVIENVTLVEAETLIENHNAVLERLVSTALCFAEDAPDDFTEFWYGKKCVEGARGYIVTRKDGEEYFRDADARYIECS